MPRWGVGDISKERAKVKLGSHSHCSEGPRQTRGLPAWLSAPPLHGQDYIFSPAGCRGPGLWIYFLLHHTRKGRWVVSGISSGVCPKTLHSGSHSYGDWEGFPFPL